MAAKAFVAEPFGWRGVPGDGSPPPPPMIKSIKKMIELVLAKPLERLQEQLSHATIDFRLPIIFISYSSTHSLCQSLTHTHNSFPLHFSDSKHTHVHAHTKLHRLIHPLSLSSYTHTRSHAHAPRIFVIVYLCLTIFHGYKVLRGVHFSPFQNKSIPPPPQTPILFFVHPLSNILLKYPPKQ